MIEWYSVHPYTGRVPTVASVCRVIFSWYCIRFNCSVFAYIFCRFATKIAIGVGILVCVGLTVGIVVYFTVYHRPKTTAPVTSTGESYLLDYQILSAYLLAYLLISLWTVWCILQSTPFFRLLAAGFVRPSAAICFPAFWCPQQTGIRSPSCESIALKS